MEAHVDSDVPQWKKDLIARLRSQNRTAKAAPPLTDGGEQSQQQLSASPQLSCGAQQPSLTCKTDRPPVQCDASREEQRCNVISTCHRPTSDMVQERMWTEGKRDPFAEMVSENYNNNGYHKDSDSDSSEDLHYGPGIVNKLKNKYLSLALRETSRARVRPSILQLRRATSLENLLDDDDDEDGDEPCENRRFQSRLNGSDASRRIIPNRYRNATRGEMKRARSVEAISRYDSGSPTAEAKPNRQSLHEDMLIEKEAPGHRKADSPDVAENKFTNHSSVNRSVNRPKRVQPLMDAKEKPPADVVKQAKMIFERRPEQRTRAPPQTGDVAAKVDSFNNFIVKAKVEAKVSKKPPIKQAKPALNDKPKSVARPVAKPVIVSEEALKLPPKTLDASKPPARNDAALPSPIPDVSRVDFDKGDGERGRTVGSLSETPDLILVSSPLPPKSASELFIKEEVRTGSPAFGPLLSPSRVASPVLLSPTRVVSPIASPRPRPSPKPDATDAGFRIVSPTMGKQAGGGTSVFNFTNQSVNQSHLPLNKNVSNAKIPPSQPLKIEINGHHEARTPAAAASPKVLLTQPPKSPPLPPKGARSSLTATEIEKNLINAVKTLQQPGAGASGVSVSSSVEVVNKSIVPKRSGRPREQESNTAVFNFTGRKDVPDYISNDRSRSPGRPQLPKPGEGGIILIPGATVGDSFTDEDEEILRSLEGPPSPCDVTFVNDNILIDGKSSLSQRTKQIKLRISFVDAGPDIYEYPSETSLLVDDSLPSPSPAQIGHTVPNLSGSSLATYTPKAMEEFHPGVTRSIQQVVTSKPDVTEVDITAELIVEEIDMPFSSGANADILF